jgi:tetratricopeptide (TPR) repeat protein
MFFILLAPLTFLKEKVHCSLMIDSNLPADAVAAALAQNWKEAIRINLVILKTQKDNLEALSRLAYAYLKTAQISLAKKTYEKVLSIDQYNHIAQKNLKKLGNLKKKDVAKDSDYRLSPLMFLEEPGKTKIVDCINLAQHQVLSLLSSGEEVHLKAKNHCIEIRSTQSTYLAALPDDMSFKLIKLLDAGNTYQAIVKGIEKNGLKVLIRELSRGKRFANQPSFTSTTSYIPFSKGGSSSGLDAPDMTPTGEEGEEKEVDDTQAEG